MEIKNIRKILELAEKFNVKEMEMSPDGALVKIKMKDSCELMSGDGAKPVVFEKRQEQANVVKACEQGSLHFVKAPMVGTVYLAPSPESKPFVSVGQKVKVGQTVCFIEAMKMFNKIESDKAGTLKERCVEDSEPVEFDQKLFVIEE